MNRRAVLLGLLAAPVIVRASSLMAVRPYVPEMRLISGYNIYGDDIPFDWLAEVRAHRMSGEFIAQWGPTHIRVSPSPNTHYQRHEIWDNQVNAWRPDNTEAEALADLRETIYGQRI